VIQFWFEFASTYSYVAAMRVEAAAGSRGIGVEWRPFLLGALFKRQGWSDSPFNLYPQRGRYMWRDVERQCARHRLPFRRPSVFPRQSLLAARIACLGIGQPWLPAFARAVYHANFAEDRDIADPDRLERLLDEAGARAPGGSTSVSGREAAALVRRAGEQATKDLLRQETDRAWDLGVCGAPFFFVEEEPFWGNDRLEEALDWQEGRRPA
jgi:2-hydroxychromene-2-carboxylate isomerase